MKTRFGLWVVLFVAGVMMIPACTENGGDDDNDTGNNGGDDCVDWDPRPNCGGYRYPECGTVIDIPPRLISVAILVNGAEATQPVVVTSSDKIEFALEYEFFVGAAFNLCNGQVFLIKNGEALCMDDDGFPDDDNYPTELPGICSTKDYGQPVTRLFDPSLFLNGEGAPYYIEISNGCATRSNRLRVEIVTVE